MSNLAKCVILHIHLSLISDDYIIRPTIADIFYFPPYIIKLLGTYTAYRPSNQQWSAGVQGRTAIKKILDNGSICGRAIDRME